MSPTPKTVSPDYLAQYEGGGSLRTIWYHGSDEEFHHFSVLHKTSTAYRIKKSELEWEHEFPLDSRDSVLVGNELSTFLNRQDETEHTATVPPPAVKAGEVFSP